MLIYKFNNFETDLGKNNYIDGENHLGTRIEIEFWSIIGQYSQGVPSYDEEFIDLDIPDTIIDTPDELKGWYDLFIKEDRN